MASKYSNGDSPTGRVRSSPVPSYITGSQGGGDVAERSRWSPVRRPEPRRTSGYLSLLSDEEELKLLPPVYFSVPRGSTLTYDTEHHATARHQHSDRQAFSDPVAVKTPSQKARNVSFEPVRHQSLTTGEGSEVHEKSDNARKRSVVYDKDDVVSSKKYFPSPLLDNYGEPERGKGGHYDRGSKLNQYPYDERDTSVDYDYNQSVLKSKSDRSPESHTGVDLEQYLPPLRHYLRERSGEAGDERLGHEKSKRRSPSPVVDDYEGQARSNKHRQSRRDSYTREKVRDNYGDDNKHTGGSRHSKGSPEVPTNSRLR